MFQLSLSFFVSLVNDTFSNLKLKVFIITGFICRNKYMKELVLVNHNWISPMLQRDGDWSSVYSPKKKRAYLVSTAENTTCIIAAETPNCINTVQTVTHIFDAETVTWISAAETSNCMIATETVTSMIAIEIFTNITITESTICIVETEPQNIHNCDRHCHLHNCYRECHFHSPNRNCHLQNWL